MVFVDGNKSKEKKAKRRAGRDVINGRWQKRFQGESMIVDCQWCNDGVLSNGGIRDSKWLVGS